MVRIHARQDMMWWEEERLLTDKDREAIDKAKKQDWTEIDEDSAETVIGKRWIREIIMRKYHRDEYKTGML